MRFADWTFGGRFKDVWEKRTYKKLSDDFVIDSVDHVLGHEPVLEIVVGYRFNE